MRSYFHLMLVHIVSGTCYERYGPLMTLGNIMLGVSYLLTVDVSPSVDRTNR